MNLLGCVKRFLRIILYPLVQHCLLYQHFPNNLGILITVNRPLFQVMHTPSIREKRAEIVSIEEVLERAIHEVAARLDFGVPHRAVMDVAHGVNPH